jgi:glycosyltransferase involved in cell wall biosynthesis
LPGNALILIENESMPFDTRVWQECLALRRAGWQVTVVSPQGVKRDRDPFEVLDGVEIHRFPLRFAAGGPLGYGREYGTALWWTWRLVRRLARGRRFDVVHACNPPDLLLLATRSLKRRGARLVFDQHDLVPELYLARFERGKDLMYRGTVALERLSYRLADVVIATNESYRRTAITRGGKRPEDVFVVRNAPDLSRFRPAEPEPELKAGKPYLLAYLGVMGPQDGVDHALRALAVLKQKRTDWRAIFIGEGDVYPEMKLLSSELGLDGLAQFTGRLPDEDVLRILSTADVCLAPDPLNPLNDISTMTKIVEYMAMGQPLVSYDLTEARVSAGDAALYAAPNDEMEFAGCIEQLLDDEALRRRMGNLGRRRVEESLSWVFSERQLVAAYEHALALGSPDVGASANTVSEPV